MKGYSGITADKTLAICSVRKDCSLKAEEASVLKVLRDYNRLRDMELDLSRCFSRSVTSAGKQDASAVRCPGPKIRAILQAVSGP